MNRVYKSLLGGEVGVIGPGVVESSFNSLDLMELEGLRRRPRKLDAIFTTVSTYLTTSMYLACCFFPDRLADLLDVELLEL